MLNYSVAELRNLTFMNKILRISMIAVLALIANFSFGQTVVTFTAETDKGSFDATQTGTGAGADKITKNGVTIQTSNGAFAATDYNTKAAQYRIYKCTFNTCVFLVFRNYRTIAF